MDSNCYFSREPKEPLRKPIRAWFLDFKELLRWLCLHRTEERISALCVSWRDYRWSSITFNFLRTSVSYHNIYACLHMAGTSLGTFRHCGRRERYHSLHYTIPAYVSLLWKRWMRFGGCVLFLLMSLGRAMYLSDFLTPFLYIALYPCIQPLCALCREV